MTRWRTRLYAAYLQAGAASEHQTLTGGLQRRRAALEALVRRHFPADSQARILDLGCGHGALLFFAHRMGYVNVHGVDVSAQQVALAARLGVRNVTQGDLLQALQGVAPASLDMVVALDVIEHFTKDELFDIVDAVALALKPGGRWLIQAPNGESPFGNAIRYGDFTHELAFTRTSLDQILRCSGFASVECHEAAPIARGVKSLVRLTLWKLIRIGLRLWSLAETGDTGRQAVFTRNLVAVATREV